MNNFCAVRHLILCIDRISAGVGSLFYKRVILFHLPAYRISEEPQNVNTIIFHAIS